MIPPPVCLRCEKRIAVERGLCPTCKQQLYRLVKAGKTTKEAEVTAGRLLPAKKPGFGGFNKAKRK